MKKIIITECDYNLNRCIGQRAMNNGEEVCFLFRDEVKRNEFQHLAGNNEADTAIMTGFWMDELVNRYDDRSNDEIVLIHGCQELNEEDEFIEEPVGLNTKVLQYLNEIFLLNKHITDIMIRRKSGRILYPMFYDVLQFINIPSSPIMNQAKISNMKCLAKELAAFKIKVNAMTFGYYDNDFTRDVKKRLKKEAEIWALKPRLNKIKEYMPAVDMMLSEQSAYISGQNIHVGLGIETIL